MSALDFGIHYCRPLMEVLVSFKSWRGKFRGVTSYDKSKLLGARRTYDFLFYFQSPSPGVEKRSIFKWSKDLKIVIVIWINIFELSDSTNEIDSYVLDLLNFYRFIYMDLPMLFFSSHSALTLLVIRGGGLFWRSWQYFKWSAKH